MLGSAESDCSSSGGKALLTLYSAREWEQVHSLEFISFFWSHCNEYLGTSAICYTNIFLPSQQLLDNCMPSKHLTPMLWMPIAEAIVLVFEIKGLLQKIHLLMLLSYTVCVAKLGISIYRRLLWSVKSICHPKVLPLLLFNANS